MGVGTACKRVHTCWMFIHGTDKAEKGLMVLFLVLFFLLPPLHLDFVLPTFLGSSLITRKSKRLLRRLQVEVP